MSKIGRRPILLEGIKVQVNGKKVVYDGKFSKGEYILPEELKVELGEGSITVLPVKEVEKAQISALNRVWGLHRALLNNIIKGAAKLFEKNLQIVGLGCKALLSGNKLIFSLGYSHKIEFEVPEGVKVEVDKSGQKLVLRSVDPVILGSVAAKIRDLRPPEPYKGTGIKYVDEVIYRKAGKAKSI